VSITITNTEKDLVAQRVLRLSRATASASQVVQIDYACNVALNRVNQYAQLWTGVDDAGDAYAADDQTGAVSVNPWIHWWVAEASWHLALAYKPEFAGVLKDAREESIEDCFSSFSADDVDSAVMDGTDYTLFDIRRSIVVSCIKRRPKRVFPDIGHVNRTIQSVMDELWNRSRWDFTRRRASIAIPTSGQPTLTITDDAGSVFDGMASKYLFLRPDTGTSSTRRIKWANANEASVIRADTGLSTGTPVYYRYSDNGDDTLTWEFFPKPDQAYTADFEVFIKGPVMTGTTDTTIATDVVRFPNEFRSLIRDYALAKILVEMNATGGVAYDNQIRMRHDPFLQTYADRGVQNDDQAIGDVYGDVQSAGSSSWGSGWFGGGDNSIGGGL